MSLTRDLADWHQEQRCQKAVEALGQTAAHRNGSAGSRTSWTENRVRLIFTC